MASPTFWVVDFSCWGWTAAAALMVSGWVGRIRLGGSRVEGTLDVVGSLLEVRLLGVGLGGGGGLVGERLSSLVVSHVEVVRGWRG